MQLDLMRGSPVSTATVTKSANAHVRDEPPALVHLQDRLLALTPLGDAHRPARAAPSRRPRRGSARSGRRRPAAAAGRPLPQPWPDRPGAARRCRARAIGASARCCARIPAAAPASTHDSSNATSASARFFGPATTTPASGSRHAVVMPARSNSARSACFSTVHSCVCRPPCATSFATGPRATPRAAWISIWRSYRSVNRHITRRASSPGSVRSVSLDWARSVGSIGVPSLRRAAEPRVSCLLVEYELYRYCHGDSPAV